MEKRIRDKSVKERFQVRQTESRPILDKLKQWLDRQQPKIPPKSLLGKALTYAQNQWKYLVRYLDSGLLEIDNNAAERGIKPCLQYFALKPADRYELVGYILLK